MQQTFKKIWIGSTEPFDIIVIKMTSKLKRLSKRKLKIAQRQGKVKFLTFTNCYPTSIE